MAVIAAFDLHYVVAAGVGARDADRMHRGLGAGVAEPQLLHVVAVADHLGELDGLGRGRREVRAVLRRTRDGLGDLRVRVADDHAAEAAVRVDVLVVVDVPHARALAVREVDRIRVALLERRAHAHGHRVQGALEPLLRLWRAVEQQRGLGRGDLVGACVESFDVDVGTDIGIGVRRHSSHPINA